MKSLKRGTALIAVLIFFFLIGMIVLIVKIILEAPMYVSHSAHAELGFVYDRNGDILFDHKARQAKESDISNGKYAENCYPEGYFTDIGNLIGDTSGQMSNTLVNKNLEKLSNYTFMAGITYEGGKAAIYTTLDHTANRKVYDSFGDKDGCAIAYNYKTGEILICTSRPNVDPVKGYDEYDEEENPMPDGMLLCKTFSKTVPGSTQKVPTTLAAIQTMGLDKLKEKSFNCEGPYHSKDDTDVHRGCWSGGHGEQNILEAFPHSCNPFFAQLVADPDWSIGDIKKYYKNMGIAVNGSDEGTISINGIISDTASTELNDKNDHETQWSCIGQGKTMVSPCQMMIWESAIANGTGKGTVPYLIDHTTNVSGRIMETADTSYTDVLFSSESAKELREIMVENGANNYNEYIGYEVGIKSGTAEKDIETENDDGETEYSKSENALLTGFVNDDDFPIAFAILVEGGSSTDSKDVLSVLLKSLDKPA